MTHTPFPAIALLGTSVPTGPSDGGIAADTGHPSNLPGSSNNPVAEGCPRVDAGHFLSFDVHNRTVSDVHRSGESDVGKIAFAAQPVQYGESCRYSIRDAVNGHDDTPRDDTPSARASRGARLLDTAIPGWHLRIDLATLDIADCGDCILGQLGRLDYLMATAGVGTPDPTTHGFYSPTGGYSDLTEAWGNEIRVRRLDPERSAAPIRVRSPRPRRFAVDWERAERESFVDSGAL